jgi:hypothetical protein
LVLEKKIFFTSKDKINTTLKRRHDTRSFDLLSQIQSKMAKKDICVRPVDDDHRRGTDFMIEYLTSQGFRVKYGYYAGHEDGLEAYLCNDKIYIRKNEGKNDKGSIVYAVIYVHPIPLAEMTCCGPLYKELAELGDMPQEITGRPARLVAAPVEQVPMARVSTEDQQALMAIDMTKS